MDVSTWAVASAWGSGALLGLASTPHCAGMCGPLAGLACGRGGGHAARARYQLGRFVGYGFAGWLGGQAGRAAWPALRSPGLGMAFLGLVAVAMLAWAWRLTRSSSTGPGWVPLRRLTAGDPRRRARLVAFKRRALDALGRLAPREPGLLGGFTALLPCGALYVALGLAAATHHAATGAAFMVGFAATTGLAVLGAGSALQWLARGRRRGWARVAAVALVVASSVLVARPLLRAQTHADTPDNGAEASHGSMPCH